MQLASPSHALPFLVENEAHEGVRRIAEKVIADVVAVSGMQPALLNAPVPGCSRYVLCATLGFSPLVDHLYFSGRFPQADMIAGKWECYAIALLENPFPGVDELLVICGSDKRGTIYGMFTLSEYIGVSPLHFWGDVDPLQRPEIIIDRNIEQVSKEPSVRYRGFFINDEWPCFGTWATQHFGGFNAAMYDHVFELLLRLKGNYLWPAMWNSAFGQEGPGIANEELADLYGVVVGHSHHEPCLRAGVEFGRSIQQGAPYGTVWNFRENREGITRFWADGLDRSGRYEHLVTIGMRGENDSAMLGQDASLRANIEYLKDVITVQEELIRSRCAPKVVNSPRVLALYKEVEPFFYGSSTVPGLKDWEGLRNTVCMLCEDNFGFMRSLPTPELTEALRRRGCGWGMYYHLDYHGGPVSYEWMPSTPFSKVWDQMCTAYDYGIRDVWIVNVGDLKGNEVGLAQFLDLAYDYDRWGSHIPDNWLNWAQDFLCRTFPTLTDSLRAGVLELLTGYMALNGMRRPEALHAGIYHPCHELETPRLLARADQLCSLMDEIAVQLNGPEHQQAADAYYSLVYYPAQSSLNLLRLQLLAGLNAHYAAQGRDAANRFASLVTSGLADDQYFAETFAAFRRGSASIGKWAGMELEQHIGFTSWNDDGCRNPLRILVKPHNAPRLSLSRKDAAPVYGKTYGPPKRIAVPDFCDAGVKETLLELANDGIGVLHFRIDGCPPWLSIEPCQGAVSDLQDIRLICDRSMLTTAAQHATLTVIAAADEMLQGPTTTVLVDVSARMVPAPTLSAYMPRRHVVAIEAHHFHRSSGVPGGAYRMLSGFGRSGHGMKVYPHTAAFQPNGPAPSLTYRFCAEETGAYTVEVWLTPTNPVRPGTPMRFSLTAPDGMRQIITAVPEDFLAGSNGEPRWCAAMLDNIRKAEARITCRAGVQEITIGAVDPNLIIERILIYPASHQLPESYLGPEESMLLP